MATSGHKRGGTTPTQRLPNGVRKKRSRVLAQSVPPELWRAERTTKPHGVSWGLGFGVGRVESERQGLNLSGSWQQGHSATYNTPSRI